MAISVPAVTVLYSTTDGTNVSVTLPTASMAAGDWIYIFGGHFRRAGVSIGPTTGVWEEVYSENAGGSTNGFGCWRQLWNGSDSSVACYGSGTSGDAAIYGRIILRGAGSVRGSVIVATGDSNNPNPGSVDTVSGDCVLIAAQSTSTDNSVTSPTNYTAVEAGVNTTNDMSCGGGYYLSPANPENPANWTNWTTGNWRAISIAVAPASAPYAQVSWFELELTQSTGSYLALGASSYALSGTATSLEFGREVAVTAGSYALTGTVVTVRRKIPLAVAAGSYALTGTAVTVHRNIPLAVNAGSYALTGTAVTVHRNIPLVVGAGSYAIAGSDVSVEHGREIIPGAGSYALSGADASLEFGRKVPVGSGNYAISGADVSLKSGKGISAEAGSYALAGNAVSLEYGREIAPSAGAYALSGTDVSLSTLAPSYAKVSWIELEATEFIAIVETIGNGAYALTGTGVAVSARTSPIPIMTYVWAADPASHEPFETFIGRTPQYTLEFSTFGPSISWETWLGGVAYVATGWAGQPQRLVLSLAPVTNGVSLADVASGTYDSYFATAADYLIAEGHEDAIIRLGWEMNFGFYPWASTGETGFTLTDWVNCWQHIHGVMNARPGAQFEWFWCPASTYGNYPTDQYYPGDAYVDYIGLDTYWMAWSSHELTPSQIWTNRVLGYDTEWFSDGQPFALLWAANFAAAHGKPLAIGEAGTGIRPDTHGAGDSSYFWINLVDFLTTQNTAFLGIWVLDAPDYWARFTLASNYTETPPADWRDDQIRTAWAIRHYFGAGADLSTAAFETNSPSGLSISIAPAYDGGGGTINVPLNAVVGTELAQLNASVGERIHWTKEDSAFGGNDGGLLWIDQNTGIITVGLTPTSTSATAIFSARNDIGGALINVPVETVAGQYIVSPGAGSYALTGSPAVLYFGREIAPSAGAYVLTGSDVSFSVLAQPYAIVSYFELELTQTTATIIVANQGTYALSGSSVSFPGGKIVSIGSGSYALAGADAALEVGRVIAIGDESWLGFSIMFWDSIGGSYVLSGTDVSVSVSSGTFVSIESGAYALSGTAISLEIGRKVAVAAGSYALAGADAALEVGHTVAAVAGSYALSGADASLEFGRQIVIGEAWLGFTLMFWDVVGGSYVLSGADVTVSISAGTFANIDSGAYALSGTATSLEFGRKIAAASGSYALAGADASLEVGHTVAAGVGSYALSGADASLEFGREVAAGAGSYALTGAGQSLEFGRKIAAGPGSYALSGIDVALSVGAAKTISIEFGVYALSGSNVSLEYDRKLTVGGGTYSLVGSDLGLEHGREIVSDAGSYALIGTDASLEFGRKLTADAGSYALTGSAVSLEMGRELVVGSGSYALSGLGASLEFGYRASIGIGSYTSSGTDVSFGIIAGRGISVSSGSYALTGSNVFLPKRLSIGSSAYALTGSSAVLERGREVAIDVGSYALSGTDVALYTDRIAPIGIGSYVQSGIDVSLFVGRHPLVAESGSYELSGSDVTLLSAKKISIGSGTYILSGIDISIIADVGRKIAVGEGAYGLSGSGMDIKFGTSAYYDVDVETFHRENVPVSVMRSAGGSSVARPDDLEPAKGRPN